jgi:capsular polysaccharide biosynthesis protein
MSFAIIPLPADAEILTLDSPGYAARPPVVHHDDLIPPLVRQAMQPAWMTSHFHPRPVRVLQLHDVWVVNDGLVFTADGSGLYAETITQHLPASIEAAHAAVLAALGDPSSVDDGGPAVLCKKPGAGNYGHWILEMLPKAHLVARRLGDIDARFIVADIGGPLRVNMLASLGLLGMNADRILFADNRPRRFRDLIVVDGLTEHGCYMSPLVMETADALAACVAPARSRKLLVSRQSVGSRCIRDEDVLLARAPAYGYTPVDTLNLPLVDQIALFKGASVIVGVMGAALTNLAFAAAGSRVVAIAPAGMPDTFFWFIATLRGLDYTEIRCAPTGPVRGNAPWDTDVVLLPEDTHSILGLD